MKMQLNINSVSASCLFSHPSKKVRLVVNHNGRRYNLAFEKRNENFIRINTLVKRNQSRHYKTAMSKWIQKILENEKSNSASKIYSLTLIGQVSALGVGCGDDALLFEPRSQEGTRVKMSCRKS